MLLAALGSGRTCWSQVTVGEEEVENNAVVQPAQAVFMMTDDQFDQWVFGGPRNSRAGRNKLDSLLTLQVDDVARMCTLSEAQKKKLLLAGRGDIKRFFDKVEEKRKKFAKVKNDQTKFNEVYQELVPLQAVLNSGLFGDGSIYSKTIRRVLSERKTRGTSRSSRTRTGSAIEPRSSWSWRNWTSRSGSVTNNVANSWN